MKMSKELIDMIRNTIHSAENKTFLIQDNSGAMFIIEGFLDDGMDTITVYPINNNNIGFHGIKATIDIERCKDCKCINDEIYTMPLEKLDDCIINK